MEGHAPSIKQLMHTRQGIGGAFTRFEEIRQTLAIVLSKRLQIDFMRIHPETLERPVEDRWIELTPHWNSIQREVRTEYVLPRLYESTYTRTLGVEQCSIDVEEYKQLRHDLRQLRR